MDCQLWGEIPETKNSELDKIVLKESGKMLIVSAFKPEASKVKHPQPDEDSDQLIALGPEHSAMEENVLYTIQLIQHAKKMTELIRLAKTKDEAKDQTTSLDVKEYPVLPKPPSNLKKTKRCFPVQFPPQEESSFARGEAVCLPALGKEVTKEILFKTVGTLCAHVGFDRAMQNTLQVLVDVAEDFLSRFTRLLRYAVDREALYGNSGFPDAMERVFHEMGFGSMICLHDFYQRRVLSYRDKCEEECINLQEQYQIIQPAIKPDLEDLKGIKIEMDCEEDIPEIHFPAMAEGEGLDSSLEPGFQMLHSLEQQAQLLEEIDSPQSVGSGTDWSSGMPKKRKRN